MTQIKSVNFNRVTVHLLSNQLRDKTMHIYKTVLLN